MSKSKQPRQIAPADCSPDQLCKIVRDNFSTKTHWILVDGSHVTICEQRPGENAKAMVSVPRKTFNTLLRWYFRPQRVRP